MRFSFGLDPEFILESNSGVKSAIGVVPGTKDKRHKIGSHYCYYDNVLAEAAVKPAQTKRDAILNIKDCLSRLSRVVHPLKLTTRAAELYPEDQLKHPDSWDAGCKSETCVYKLRDMELPLKWFSKKSDGKFKFKTNLRSAGGHIHLGGKIAKEKTAFVVRMLDLFVGVPSLFLDKDPSVASRRQIYGNAGRYREPDHGLEYRPLGNFWLASPDLVELIYDLCEFTIDFVANDKHLKFWSVDESKLTDECWNTRGFDPATAYDCFGYDAADLQEAIKTNNRFQGMPLLMLAIQQFPAELSKKLQVMTEAKSPNLYEAWELN